MSLMAQLSDNTNYQFSEEKVAYLMKKIVQSIEDDAATSTSAEVWLGDPP